jgi:hypothetical protein
MAQYAETENGDDLAICAGDRMYPGPIHVTINNVCKSLADSLGWATRL